MFKYRLDTRNMKIRHGEVSSTSGKHYHINNHKIHKSLCFDSVEACIEYHKYDLKQIHKNMIKYLPILYRGELSTTTTKQ